MKVAHVILVCFLFSATGLGAQADADAAADSAVPAKDEKAKSPDWKAEIQLFWDDRDPLGDPPFDVKALVELSLEPAPGISLEMALDARPEEARLAKALIILGAKETPRFRLGYGKASLSADGLLPDGSASAAWENCLERFVDDAWVRRAPLLGIGNPWRKGGRLTWDLAASFAGGQLTPQSAASFLWRFRGKDSGLGASFSYYPRLIAVDSSGSRFDWAHSWLGALLLRDHAGSFLYGGQLAFGTDLPEPPEAIEGLPDEATPPPAPFKAWDGHLGFRWKAGPVVMETNLNSAGSVLGPRYPESTARSDFELWLSQGLASDAGLSVTADLGWRWRQRPDGNLDGLLLAVAVRAGGGK